MVEARQALTGRERQVMSLVASGSSNKEVAKELFLSVETVKTHLTRIYIKFGVTNRAEAVAVFARQPPGMTVTAVQVRTEDGEELWLAPVEKPATDEPQEDQT